MGPNDKPIPVYRYGTKVSYAEVTAKQEEWVDQRKEALLLCEHPPTITLGSASKPDDLSLSPIYYERLGYTVFQSPRGGQATYHGPGQLVIYPILNLRARDITVHGHIRFLEDIMMRLCALYGIKTYRIEGKSGSWVNENRKIGFTGIRVRKGFAYHGASLNVTPQAEAFRTIIPCGMSDIYVTSIHEECPSTPEVWEVADIIETYIFESLSTEETTPKLA